MEVTIDIIKDTTVYWRVQQLNGQCYDSITGPLWLVSLLLYPAAWSLILGASDVRTILGRLPDLLLSFNVGDNRKKLRFAIAIAGSFAIQLGLTIATANMLRDQGQPTSTHSFGSSVATWLLRPLPATFLQLVGLASATTYARNGIEVQVVEFLYSIPSVVLCAEILHQVLRANSVIHNVSPSSSPSYNSGGTVGSSMSPSVTPTSPTIAASASPTRSSGTIQTPSPSTIVSTDRTCGGEKRVTCKGSQFGSCCSSFGYCGSDSGYCGDGCQPAFGDCGSVHARAVGNICGGSWGDNCVNSTFGPCCSQYGYCGSNSSYCGYGCQSAFGSCWAVGSYSNSTATVDDLATTKRSLDRMEGAAALGLTTSIISILTFIALLVYYVKRGQPLRRRDAQLAVGLLTFSNMVHFIVCCLLWSGALEIDPFGFCPSAEMSRKITILWALVPGIDHIWRGVVNG